MGALKGNAVSFIEVVGIIVGLTVIQGCGAASQTMGPSLSEQPQRAMVIGELTDEPVTGVRDPGGNRPAVK